MGWESRLGCSVRLGNSPGHGHDCFMPLVIQWNAAEILHGKPINSHRVKFPGLYDTWSRNHREQVWTYLHTLVLPIQGQNNPKTNQNPQSSPCYLAPHGCPLPPVLSVPAAREDAEHSGLQEMVLSDVCWLNNHLALYMPPPKLDLATMKLETKSSRWH